MGNILYNISQVLGLTIINSLWQGLLVYFVLRMVLMAYGNLPASKKYVLACGSLLVITLWFGYTLIKQIYLFNWLAAVPAKLHTSPIALALPAGIGQVDGQSLRYYYNIEGWLPYVAVVYILGLMFNTARIIAANKKLNFIRKAAIIDLALQQQVQRFISRLGIGKSVRIGLSGLVSVPCMTGYVKPMILLPLTLQTYLSASEIEAIILHELAHIKRNDYLVNILQQAIAILLFFNPCAQLISKIINEERENSCDDLVVKAEAEPITYAKALLKLAQNSHGDRQLALAATGKKYHLLNRIERIMKTNKQKTGTRPALLAMLIFTLVMGGIALFNPQIAQGKISVKTIRPVIEQLLTDTGKKQAAATVQPKAKHVAPKRTETISQQAANAKIDELNAKIKEYSDAVNAYYASQDYKDMQAKMEALGKNMQVNYDNPDAKKIEAEMTQLSEQTQGYYNDAKMQAISAELGEKGRKIGAYYNSPEFKKLDAGLKKKYGIPEHREFGDDKEKNYEEYQAELAKHIPADVKLTEDDMHKLSTQVSAYYGNTEMKSKAERMRALGDSLRSIYQSPQVVEQQKEIRELGKQISSYNNSPEIKKQQEMLNKYVKELTAYVKSAAYKDYIYKQVNDYKSDYKYDYKADGDKQANGKDQSDNQ